MNYGLYIKLMLFIYLLGNKVSLEVFYTFRLQICL